MFNSYGLTASIGKLPDVPLPEGLKASKQPPQPPGSDPVQ